MPVPFGEHDLSPELLVRYCRSIRDSYRLYYDDDEHPVVLETNRKVEELEKLMEICDFFKNRCLTGGYKVMTKEEHESHASNTINLKKAMNELELYINEMEHQLLRMVHRKAKDEDPESKVSFVPPISRVQ